MEQKSYQEHEDDSFQLSKLKEILLREDRDALLKLEEILEDKEKLSGRVSPIIKDHLEFFKNNFPDEFKEEVKKITKQQFIEGQEELLNALYPSMGKMIKRYIAHEFQKLKDSIDDRVKKVFSSQGVWGRIKASIFGINSSEIILSNIDKPTIEEIFVVQRDSGLLLGQASRKKTIDQDVVAGMLTAIKAFVEDAFNRGSEDLEMIEYDTHAIFTQSFHSYYIAIAMKGSLSSQERDDLSTSLYEFAEKELKHQVNKLDETNFKYISDKLDQYFISEQPIKERTTV